MKLLDVKPDIADKSDSMISKQKKKFFTNSV